MNLKHSFLITAFGLSLCLASLPSLGKDYAIAFSPALDPVTAKSQVKQSLQFLTSLEPGDQAWLLDGFQLRTLGRFTVPDNPAYNSPKARLAVNRKAVGALMHFAKNADPNGLQRGALRLPQLLRHIASNKTTDQLEVILFGSPHYSDPDEPAFSMTEGVFPGDGHLRHNRSKTPFGAAGLSGLLENVRIHQAYDPNTAFINDSHLYFVERFWTLYIEVLGGELVSFTGDLSTALRRAQNNVRSLPHGYKAADTDKLEMIRLRPAKVQSEQIKQSIYQRPLSKLPLTTAQIEQSDHVEIGLSWDCKSCDLDLYARPHSGAAILFFGHKRSPEGEFWKDFLTSPRNGRVKGFETISFHTALDLRALKIAVNFYNGSAPDGVNGELRLSVQGQTYAKGFTLSETKGNRSAQAAQRAIEKGQITTAHTILIDPLSLLPRRG